MYLLFRKYLAITFKYITRQNYNSINFKRYAFPLSFSLSFYYVEKFWKFNRKNSNDTSLLSSVFSLFISFNKIEMF